MPETMRALAKLRPGEGLEPIETEVPRCGPRDVIVKVQATSICGTDLHIYNWDEWSQGRIKPPLVIGHELAGEVVEVGAEVTQTKVGDYVAAESHFVCGVCFQCRNGLRHYCQDAVILGVDVPGCFAEYVKVPVKAVWLTDRSIPPHIACLQEPMGNAMYTVTEGHVSARTVLVTGCGPFGLFAVGIARSFGASEIFVVEPNPFRAALALKMGADVVIDPSKEEIAGRVREITGGAGVDVLLEMSGNAAALEGGFTALKNGGTVSLFGLPKGRVTLDLTADIIFKGAHVTGIHGRKIWETWYQVTDLLRRKRIDVDPIVTHRFPLAEFEKGMALMRQGNCGKIVLTP
jgi:threonine 3-dehydrogenase